MLKANGKHHMLDYKAIASFYHPETSRLWSFYTSQMRGKGDREYDGK